MSSKIDTQTIRLNTILYPSKKDREEFVKAGVSCTEFGDTYIAVDDLNYLPHITLYFPDYPVDKLDSVLTYVKQVADNTNSIKLKLESITGHSDGGIFINYTNTDDINLLKQKVVDKLNPLRGDLIRDKYKDDMSEDVLKYGYPINKYHFPHITLVVFEDALIKDKFLEQDILDFGDEILIDKIAVCKMGEYGTCTELLGEFNLIGTDSKHE